MPYTMSLRFAGWLTLALAVVGSLYAVDADDSFDRRAMLQSIVEYAVYPGQEAFTAAADELLAAAEAFVDAPDAVRLEAMQDAWRRASNAWEEIALLALDLRITAIHNRIDKPPLNIEFVGDILAGDAPIDAAAVENMGSTVRGLPAIEYLIFDPDLSAAAIVMGFEETRRRDYLLALAQNLADKARELQAAWSPEGRDYASRFINADQAAGQIQGSINMLANKMFEQLETSLQMRLGEPAGIALGTGARPDLVESPRSQHSLAQIKHGLIGMRRLFNGGEGDDALGFNDYLDFVGATADTGMLSELIERRFQEVFAAIEVIELPLAVAVVEDAAGVAALYEAMRQLLIPLRVDMKSQLSILLTFSDRDGDQ